METIGGPASIERPKNLLNQVRDRNGIRRERSFGLVRGTNVLDFDHELSDVWNGIPVTKADRDRESGCRPCERAIASAVVERPGQPSLWHCWPLHAPKADATHGQGIACASAITRVGSQGIGVVDKAAAPQDMSESSEIPCREPLSDIPREIADTLPRRSCRKESDRRRTSKAGRPIVGSC